MRYVLRPTVLTAEVKGEQVLLDPERGVYHLVNKAGRIILDEMAKGRDLTDAIETVASRAGEPVERVRVDVDGFVKDLSAQQLIEEAT
jgi:hypothetical protein